MDIAKQRKQPKTIKLHEFISKQIEVCGKSQRELALELGYKNPNIITMFKQARTKVPLDKIGIFAQALGVDKVNLLRIAMLEYYPEMWKVIESIMGKAVTDNEYEIVQTIRENLEDPSSDPHMRSQREKNLLIDFSKAIDA